MAKRHINWNATQKRTRLPNTELNSAHDGLDFACFVCGETIISGDEIAEIKRGAIWTNCVPATVKKGKKFHNKFKNCTSYGAHCSTCNNSVGAIYLEEYEGAERAFPCAKLTYMRESSKTNEIFNSLALLIDEEAAALGVLQKLTLSADQTDIPDNGVRLNQRNYAAYRHA